VICEPLQGAYTARMQIRDSVEAATALVTPTTENGGIAIDVLAKTITVTMTAAATALLTWDAGVYEIEMISPGGAVATLASGTVAVTMEITR